jgi:hypothetical protein
VLNIFVFEQASLFFKQALLDGEGIMVQHIDETGKLKAQKEVASEFNKGYQSGDLFGG